MISESATVEDQSFLDVQLRQAALTVRRRTHTWPSSSHDRAQ
jgi:hypothetical protein